MAAAVGRAKGGGELAAYLTAALEARNAREARAFTDLVEGHTKLQRERRSLAARLALLEREASDMTEENAGLKEALHLATENAQASVEARKHEEKAAALQEELNASYKVHAEVCQQLVEAQTTLSATQATLAQREEALAQGEANLREAVERISELRATVDHERAARSAASDELEARQLERDEALQRAAALERENKELVERLMQIKLAEAERMNEANLMIEEATRVAEKARLTSAVDGQTPVDVSKVAWREDDLGGGVAIPTKIRHRFVANAGGVHAIAWDRDKAVRLWEIGTGRVKHTLTGHTDKVAAVCFSPMDSTRAVTVGNDRCIKVWDLTKGYCVSSMIFHSSCSTICFTMDGGTVCSGHFDGAVRFWDVRKGAEAHAMPGLHQQQVTSLVLSPNGCEVLTNSRDNTLKLLDIHSFQASQVFTAPGYRVGMNWCRACFSPDGRYIAAGSSDGGVALWDAHTAAPLPSPLVGHKGAVAACAWSRSGFLASADKNGECILWQ